MIVVIVSHQYMNSEPYVDNYLTKKSYFFIPPGIRLKTEVLFYYKLFLNFTEINPGDQGETF